MRSGSTSGRALRSEFAIMADATAWEKVSFEDLAAEPPLAYGMAALA